MLKETQVKPITSLGFRRPPYKWTSLRLIECRASVGDRPFLLQCVGIQRRFGLMSFKDRKLSLNYVHLLVNLWIRREVDAKLLQMSARSRQAKILSLLVFGRHGAYLCRKSRIYGKQLSEPLCLADRCDQKARVHNIDGHQRPLGEECAEWNGWIASWEDFP